MILLSVAVAAVLLKFWRDDFLRRQEGHPNPSAIPGATPARTGLLVVAATGALCLVGLETAGEYALGVSESQSEITWLFLFAMMGAGVVEEVLFRGYLVVDTKGKAALVGSIVGFSLLFALLHFQYYTEESEDGLFGYVFQIDAQSSWTLFLLFLNSLWFYAVRFIPANRERSLLPCFVAHIASNSGHVTALY